MCRRTIIGTSSCVATLASREARIAVTDMRRAIRARRRHSKGKLQPLALLAVVSATLVAMVSPTALATTEANTFDSEDWMEGLVDVRTTDLRNTSLSSTGFSDGSLEVTIPRGTFRGLGPFDRLSEQTDEAWYRYHIQLLDFDSDSSGKLPGLSGIYSHTGKGCYPSRAGSPGWSARGLFGAAGTHGAPAGEVPIGLYIYHLDQPRDCGESFYWPDSSLRPGRWHCIEGYVRMNEPGVSDGVVMGWLDGTRRFSRTGMAFRRAGEENIGIREMWLDIYYGGKQPATRTLDLVIDEVAVSTTGRVGCLDQKANLTGSFDQPDNVSIASFEPSTGEWLIHSPAQNALDTSNPLTFKNGYGWASHLAGDFTGNGMEEIASFSWVDGTWWVSGRVEGEFGTDKWATTSKRGVSQNHVAGDFAGQGNDQIATYDLDTGEWSVLNPRIDAERVEPLDSLQWVPPATPESQTIAEIRADLAEATTPKANSFQPSSWGVFRTAKGWADQVVGDFDGDGLDDIANYIPEYGSWYVSRSTGERFVTRRWTRFAIRTGWSNQVVGDFNGDGLDDIANYNADRGSWWIGISDGTSFRTTRWSTFNNPTGWTGQLVVDVNGDGLDDVANHHARSNTWWIGISNGQSFEMSRWDA